MEGAKFLELKRSTVESASISRLSPPNPSPQGKSQISTIIFGVWKS